MIRTVGLEMKWPPTIIGGLFVREGYDSLEYWYKAVLQKQRQEEEGAVQQLVNILIAKRR